MDNRAIGIFDSGLGGLTAVRALRALLPRENIVYFADTARMPYGAWSAETLRVMAKQDLDFVASKGVKCILAACGTVSSTAPDILAAYPVRTFNVLSSTVRETAREDNSPVGVIATAASIKSGAFKRALQASIPGVEVIDVACPAFVPLIESGRFAEHDEELAAAVAEYLTPIRDARARSLILGCTHYGLIERPIRRFLGEDVRLIEASVCAARELADYLTENDLCGGTGEERYYTSGSAEDFTALSSLFLGRGVRGRVGHVAPMEAEK